MAQAVTIELDRVRRIRFDVNAISDAEEILGTSLGRAMQSRAGVREIRALLWAGLRWEDRGLTLERAGTILQRHLEAGVSLEDVGTKIGEALVSCGIFKTENDEGNVKAEAAQ